MNWLSYLQEKESQLGDDLGRDQQSVYALQRYHRAFEADLQPLGNQVIIVVDDNEKL